MKDVRTGSYSRMSKKCRNCIKQAVCEHKKLEKLAFIIPNKTAINKNIVESKKIHSGKAMMSDTTKSLQSISEALQLTIVQNFNQQSEKLRD